MLDFRYAARTLRRAPGFTLAVVLTLGLGIGANSAIFSVVRGVLLKPLPHRDGSRLMYLKQSTNGPGGANIAFSVPEINDFRTASTTLGGIAEYSPITVSMVSEHDATRFQAGLVTGNYFAVMGLSPILGRAFDRRDDGAGAAPVIMLTREFWRTRFGGDPAVVGRVLHIGGKGVTVVGVLQSAPSFPQRIDAFMNMVNSEHHLSALMITGRTHRMTEMIARLAPGATVEQARAEVASITRKAHLDHPDAYDAGSGYRVTLTPFRDALGENARLTLWLLMGAAAFVLVIACANVANLTLMRGVRREHELTVRAALGAGTARLRRLLLAENLLLAFTGTVLGLAIAVAAVRLLASFAARYSTRADDIGVDYVVVAFALLLALLVALLLAFAPTLAREEALGAALTSSAKRSTGGVRRLRLQGALVVTQVAVSVVLLTGAGLLLRTMQQLAVVPSGLQTENVLSMEVPHDFTGPVDSSVVTVYEQMRQRLAAIPGVTEVGLGSTAPLRAAGIMLEVKAEGRPVTSGAAVPRAEYRAASPEYFHAAGIPLLRGHTFTTSDRANAPKVVILNQTLADQLFPGQDPIGRRIAWTGDVLRFIGVSDQWRTVVGVVGDTRDGGLDAAPLPVTFEPFAQTDFPSGAFVIRARGDVADVGPAATRVIRELAPTQPIEHVMTVTQIREESVGPRRLNATLVGAFGVLALVVAAIGIAAVLAFSVSARTNEIGIRMSLGADANRVLWMVVSEGGRLVGIGLVIGVVGSLLTARMIQGLLFRVAGHDPMTLAAVVGVMTMVGLIACVVPAVRAARIDPGMALRAR
jgi:putative ABC transport system permease protein